MKQSNLLLSGIIFYGMLSCTKTEYIEIEHVVEKQVEEEKENG